MKKLLLLPVFIFLISVFDGAQTIDGTYAIQNTATGKNLRPYEASNQNNNKIVLYDHMEWKCMTWKFISVRDNTYLLKNRFTSKTFQPKEISDKNGSALEQLPLSNSEIQQWEFIKAPYNNNYYIRFKGTYLYVTTSSFQTNIDIILQKKQSNLLQLCRLVAQNPSI
jgi:hypothetical protein